MRNILKVEGRQKGLDIKKARSYIWGHISLSELEAAAARSCHES